jgi:acetyl esterase
MQTAIYMNKWYKDKHTLIQVAENDILRDEGEAYGRKLKQAGVNVLSVRYNRVFHDFGM